MGYYINIFLSLSKIIILELELYIFQEIRINGNFYSK